MGIEEIKKAKEEAKKSITRPSQKVAALLIALGPTTASEILKNIKDEDLLEQLTLDIANLGKVSDEDLNDVLNEFKAVFQAKNFVASGGVNYAKQLLSQAYGDAEASKMLESTALSTASRYTANPIALDLLPSFFMMRSYCPPDNTASGAPLIKPLKTIPL